MILLKTIGREGESMDCCPDNGAGIETGAAVCPACEESPASRTEATAPDGGTIRWQDPGRRQSDRRRPSKLPPGRRIGLLLLALLLLAGAAILLLRFSWENGPGVRSRKEETAAPDAAASDSGLKGYYRLSGYSSAGGEAIPADVDGYLIFNGDGTGVACLPGCPAQSFTCSASQLRLSDGTVFSCTAEGDTVSLRSGALLVFTRSETQEDFGVIQAEPGDIPINSRWTGVLEISGHKGEGTLKDGTMDVWGLIRESDSGRQYFELFAAGDREEESRPILSMWVQIDGARLVPVIGEKDAWLFDIWLENADEAALSMSYKSGRLRCSYRYAVEEESCTVSFRLTPDPG